MEWVLGLTLDARGAIKEGVFVEFVIEYGLLDEWTTSATALPEPLAWPGTPVEKTYKIGIINNSDNDRDVYLQKYDEAYGSLSKVPELSERAS